MARRHPGYWQDWIGLLLGAWLFISPWMLGYAGVANAALNAWMVGAVVVLVSAASLARFGRRWAWIAVVLGLWLLIAPFVLQVAAVAEPVYWNMVGVGALLVLVAGWSLAVRRRRRRSFG